MSRIECSVPEELLVKEEGFIDDETRFAVYRQYTLQGVVVHRSEATVVWKRIPYDAQTPEELRLIVANRPGPDELYAAFEEYLPGKPLLVEVDGVRKMMDPSELDKTTRVVRDDFFLFQSAVEFRLKGTDTIVKQTGDVQYKRGIEAQGSVGGVA